MSIEQQVVEKLRELSPEKQREVLDFLNSLEQNKKGALPRRSLRGLWRDLKVSISEEEIAEGRREMWSNFPRDIS